MHNQISHDGGAARDSRRTVGRDLCRDGIDVILTFCAYATSYMPHVDDIKTTCGEKTGSPNVQFREHGARAASISREFQTFRAFEKPQSFSGVSFLHGKESPTLLVKSST